MKKHTQPNAGDLRVWWMSQVPMQPFHVSVPDVKTAKLVLDCIARYDIFQLEHNVKPDFCNAGGLERFDPEDIIPEECDGWTEWYDETTGEDIDDLMRGAE